MRQAGPVVPVRLPGGLLAWMVTDHRAIIGLLTDDRVSKDVRHWAAMNTGQVPAGWPLMPWVVGSGMFTAGGAEHRRLRRLAAPAFTGHRTGALAPMIEQIVADTLDDVTTHLDQDRTVDLREKFCFPIPIKTIGALLGVDDDLFDAIKSGANALFDTAVTPEEFAGRFAGLNAAIAELVTRKRHRPGTDLTSALIRARQHGDRYSDEEILETARVVVVAGYETTVNLLDQAIVALLTHPQHLAAAQAGHITWDDVIDETLRHQSPAANLPLRYAVEDIELAGTTIRGGEAILVSFAGAGRDPRIHEHPDKFDPTRTGKTHLGFGYGSHRCLGAPLAILEAKIALPALFDRFRDLTLAEAPEAIPANPGFITNGHARVPVRLS
ncbi:cytochrome P450 family protein [Myceligenerans salitolerans]|uniref:cytochrome P450 family protein n=1 Tax=Myceligenerans salitolerans TaxID=1230528 RepID=UPI0027DC57F6|nr:cytochrome P450 [Myceligenerans salitolerans]